MSSLVSSLGTSLLPRFDALDSKLDSLDVQVPDDLAAKLVNLDTAISNIDLGSIGSSFVTADSVDGNFCKFIPGDLVYYGLYGTWEVVNSSFVLVSEDTYTPVYFIRQITSDDGVVPVTYRYNKVPQSVLTRVVPVSVTAITSGS